MQQVPVKNDLRYHGVIGNHHSHRTEQHLQVVRQLGATGVTVQIGIDPYILQMVYFKKTKIVPRVHRNEWTTSWLQL